MISRSKTVWLNGQMTITWICLGFNLIAISSPVAARPSKAMQDAELATSTADQNPDSLAASSSNSLSWDLSAPDSLIAEASGLNGSNADRSDAVLFNIDASDTSLSSTDLPGSDKLEVDRQTPITQTPIPEDSLSVLNYIHAAANLPHSEKSISGESTSEILTGLADDTLPTVATPIVAVTADECLADCNPTEPFAFNPPIPDVAIPPRSTYPRAEVAQTPVLPVPAYPGSASGINQTVPPPPTRADSLAPLPSTSSQPDSLTAPTSPANSDALTPTTTAAQLTPADRFSDRALTPPTAQFQGVYLYQGSEDSARMRVTAVYPILPELQVGGTLEFTEGGIFSESGDDGLAINELYAAASVPNYPNLRFVVGQLDLTSYFDRNSFAKDSATQFFNPVFATNPALSAAGIGSRQAALLNWTPIDEIEVKAAVFSSDRSISDFEVNAFAGEIGGRIGNFILRGTYVTSEDAGADTGFDEIYSIRRSNGDFGLRNGDREDAYGINAEYFIPEINLGLFARYGWYENRDVDRGATTYSVGLNLLDLFMRDDRLGIAYGRQLSNGDLRDGKNPDVFEAFYDFRVLSWLRLGVTLQGLDEFSETIAGFRIRTDFDLVPPQRTRPVNTTTPRRTP